MIYARHILEHLSYYEKAISELIRIAQKEVIIVFFHAVKGIIRKGEDIIKITRDGYYSNTYDIEKLENFVLRNKKVKKIMWRNLESREKVLHIYMERRS